MSTAPFSQAGPTAIRSIERWRKVASVAVVAAFLVVLLFTESSASVSRSLIPEIVGLLLVIVAALGRVWCAIYIAGRKNSELCQDGPYSLCRNPLYLCTFFWVIGVALIARLGCLAAVLALPFWIYHHFVIRSEERRLRFLFGDEFTRYTATVPRIIPRLHGFSSRAAITVDPRRMARVLGEVAWFLLALIALEVIEHVRGDWLSGFTLPILLRWPF